MRDGADVIVVGAGLAGLVATAELADSGRRVILLEQEPAPWLGGQAFWSFGGLFLVNSPEQRRLGVRDSQERAQQDWMVTAGFDRPEDHWPRQWAEAYVAFAAGEKRSWLRSQGMHFFPVVGWAERGGSIPGGPGNSVPRFHVTWGTGPAVVAPFERRVREAAANGLVTIKFRHRVDTLTVSGGAVDGVRCVHQPRSHVALRGRDPELEPDLAGSRDPDPARSLIDVVRRARKSPSRAALPRLRHARHTRARAKDGLRLFVVCSDAADHQARVRALRVRAESGPDEQGRSPAPAAGRLEVRNGAG